MDSVGSLGSLVGLAESRAAARTHTIPNLYVFHRNEMRTSHPIRDQAKRAFSNTMHMRFTGRE